MTWLIACEYSGRVRDAFLARGIDAVSCDLLPTEVDGPHIVGDVTELLQKRWAGVIAHPPCTYLSKAGARWMHPTKGMVCPDRIKLAIQARDFFTEILRSNAPRIAIENPTPLRVVMLPEHTQVIQPYEFGDAYSKRTLLWLRGLPQLVPTNVVSNYTPYLPSNTGGAKRGQINSGGSAATAADRSRTFQGIADAMASQWGPLAERIAA
jgi:hypothetical protein